MEALISLGDAAPREVADAAEGGDCARGGEPLRTEEFGLLEIRRITEEIPSLSRRRDRSRAGENDGQGELGIVWYATAMVVLGKNERAGWATARELPPSRIAATA